VAQRKRLLRHQAIGGSLASYSQAGSVRAGKGIENVMKDLANRRPVPKELSGHREFFRDNGPLEKALSRL
jgi:hypothetical protein